MGQASAFVSNLVKSEIDRIVAEAAMERRTLSAPVAAAEILKTYPRCGLSAGQIADAVMMAAARAGVVVEIGRPVNEGDNARDIGRTLKATVFGDLRPSANGDQRGC